MIKTYGNYYFPLAALTATQLIYWDYSMNTAGRYSQTHYRLQLEAAGADDGLLSAFRGVVTRQFSTPFRGFPQTVPTFTGDNEITYYNSIEVERRMALLTSLIGDRRDLISNFDALAYSPRELANMSLEEFTERIVPVVQRFLESDPQGPVIDGYAHLFKLQNLARAGTNDEAMLWMADEWHKIFTGPAADNQQSFAGAFRWYLFSSDYTPNPNQGGPLGNLQDASAYLRTVLEQRASFWTPAVYFENWALWLRSLREEKHSARAALNGLSVCTPYTNPDTDMPEADEAKFRLCNQPIIFNALEPLYEAAHAEATKIENLRTERNRLEKLIIE